MATEFVMPKLGMAMKEGVVSSWHKHTGDSVKKGEVIASINSEKIEMDLEAPNDGELLKIAVEENQEVPPGTVICLIGKHNEQVLDIVNSQELKTENTPPKVANEALPVSMVNMSRNSSVKISPVARKIAQAAEINIINLVGTGPQGRITKEDVESAINQENNHSVQLPEKMFVPEQLLPVSPFPELVEGDQIQPVSGMRKVIATRLNQSLQNTAQLTLFSKADVTELKALQQQLSTSAQDLFTEKLTFTDFIARAVVLALMQHKQMNCALINDEIHVHDQVHLGIAVALEKGLVVPVIRNAENYSIRKLSNSIKSFSQRARKGELTGDEMKGSTFSITNLGTSGVNYFTPILNTPETGILGIGSVQDEPVYMGEELKRRSLLPLSLTFDHRVLDGAPAAAFLHSVKEYLEKPLSLLL